MRLQAAGCGQQLLLFCVAAAATAAGGGLLTCRRRCSGSSGLAGGPPSPPAAAAAAVVVPFIVAPAGAAEGFQEPIRFGTTSCACRTPLSAPWIQLAPLRANTQAWAYSSATKAIKVQPPVSGCCQPRAKLHCRSQLAPAAHCSGQYSVSCRLLTGNSPLFYRPQHTARHRGLAVNLAYRSVSQSVCRQPSRVWEHRQQTANNETHTQTTKRPPSGSQRPAETMHMIACASSLLGGAATRWVVGCMCGLRRPSSLAQGSQVSGQA